MYQSVLDAFVPFSKDLEGETAFMYKDNRNLVTSGMGNLMDDTLGGGGLPQWVVDLDWRIGSQDGRAATGDEIRACWNLVKNDTSMDVNQGGAQYARLAGNNCRLSEEAYAGIIQKKVLENVEILKGYFPAMDTWPADAQLGVLAMSWGLGPHFARTYPSFTKAVNAVVPEFATAAIQSTWSNINANRDKAQKLLFQNAEAALQKGVDFATLIWPSSALESFKAGVTSAGQVAGRVAGQAASATGQAASAAFATPKQSGLTLGKIAAIAVGGFAAVKVWKHRDTIKGWVSPAPVKVDESRTAATVQLPKKENIPSVGEKPTQDEYLRSELQRRIAAHEGDE